MSHILFLADVSNNGALWFILKLLPFLAGTALLFFLLGWIMPRKAIQDSEPGVPSPARYTPAKTAKAATAVKPAREKVVNEVSAAVKRQAEAAKAEAAAAREALESLKAGIAAQEKAVAQAKAEAADAQVTINALTKQVKDNEAARVRASQRESEVQRLTTLLTAAEHNSSSARSSEKATSEKLAAAESELNSLRSSAATGADRTSEMGVQMEMGRREIAELKRELATARVQAKESKLDQGGAPGGRESTQAVLNETLAQNKTLLSRIKDLEACLATQPADQNEVTRLTAALQAADAGRARAAAEKDHALQQAELNAARVRDLEAALASAAPSVAPTPAPSTEA